MSFNIRYNNPADGENAWDKRKLSVVHLIQQYQPDIIGVQEALVDQKNFIDSLLLDYQSVGVGREDGQIAGEYACIFIDTIRFSIGRSGTFWLSESLDLPSKSWDAALERICTYTIVNDRQTGDSIAVYNTHFDHKGSRARYNSASLILKVLKQRHSKDMPVVLLGDLNASPKSSVVKLLSSYLEDSHDCSDMNPGFPSYNGWKEAYHTNKRIDYILYRNMVCRSAALLLERRTERLFVSDHFPAFAELVID